MHYLSLHCLPMRPGRSCAIKDHRLAPNLPTRLAIFSSSCMKRTCSQQSHRLQKPPCCLTSLVQGPLTSSGFNTFCHLWRHCTSVLSSKYSAAHVAQAVTRPAPSAARLGDATVTSTVKCHHMKQHRKYQAKLSQLC